MFLMAHDEPTKHIGPDFFEDGKPVLQLACSKCTEPWFCDHVRTVIGHRGPPLGRIFKTPDFEFNYEYPTVKFAMPFEEPYDALHVVHMRRVPDARGLLYLTAPRSIEPYAIIDNRFESLYAINFMVEQWAKVWVFESMGFSPGWHPLCNGCENSILTVESQWSYLSTKHGLCYRCYLQANAVAMSLALDV